MSPVRTFRSLAGDWRTFAGSRYRPFHAVSTGQAFIGALATESIVIPVLLALGAHPALASIIATLPLAGSAIQRSFPNLLRRSGGRLRRLTLLLTLLGETRGFALALVMVLVAVHAIPAGLAVALVAIIVCVGQTLGIVSFMVFQSWYAVVLPESDRRRIAPRLTVLNQGLQAILLLPAAVIIGVGSGMGLWGYAICFAFGGIGSIVVLAGALRLPHPGRVLVPLGGSESAAEGPALASFRRVSIVGAVGWGIMPYTSVFIISVLHESAALAITVSSLAMAASLTTALVVGTFLGTGSSSRVLRVSFLVRAIAVLCYLVAFVTGPLAGVIVAAGAVLHSVGHSAGTMASNERLFRLAVGPAMIRHQGRFVAETSVGAFGGQLVAAVAIALAGPLGPLTYVPLYLASFVSRLVATARTEVSPTWQSPSVVPVVADNTIPV